MNQAEHWGYTVNEWQTKEFREILDEAFTQKVDVIYDIGACVGGWSYVVKRNYGKDTYAFEPFKPNFEYMKDKISGVALNYGIYYGKTKAKAMWRGSNVGAVYVDEVDTTMSVDTHQEFDLKTLEELDLPRPDLIKLDVEGAELNIVENSTLLKSVPQIILEWHFRETKDGKDYLESKLPHKVVKNLENNMFLLRL